VLERERLIFVGDTRQKYGLLEGGRNLLLESAQKATLMSVATSAFQRQSNSVAAPIPRPVLAHRLTLYIDGLYTVSTAQT
jgi:hypothetical protein